jgi:DNA-binding Xre family transcriptional regulator
MIHSDKDLKGVGVVRSRLKEIVAQKERTVNRSIQQKEIAEVTGLTEHTISRWMRPTPFTRIETDVALKLCQYLNCELGELLYIDYNRQN